MIEIVNKDNNEINMNHVVEKNDTKEQRKGIGLVYDFIQNYNNSFSL